MAVTDKFKNLFDNAVASYRVILWVKDNGVKASNGLSYTRKPEWVDFSDHVERDGRNLLSKISTIQHSTEQQAGTGMVASKSSSISLSNASGIFNEPFPSTLKTIYGNTAYFSTTKNGKLTNLYNHLVQIRLRVTFQDNSTEEGTLGTFKIAGMKKSNKSTEVTVTLTDLSQILREDRSAESVKDGLSWYQNRPIKFLLKELLRDRYYDKTDTTYGDIPATYQIPDVIEIPTAFETMELSSDTRALSIFGRPPENDGDSDTWLNKGMITRSTVYVPSTSDNLDAGVYLGCDNATTCEVWRYDRSVDKYYQIQSDGSDWSLDDYYIWRMWYDDWGYYLGEWTVEGRDCLILVCVSKSSWSDSSRGVTIKIYKYDGTTMELLSTINDVYTGEYCYREGHKDTYYSNLIGSIVSYWYHTRSAGSYDGFFDWVHGENVPIPFNQRVTNATVETSGTNTWHQIIMSKTIDLMGLIETTNPWTSLPAEITGQVYGWMFDVLFDNDPTDTKRVAGFRFSLGQSGFCEFNKEQNCIVYATMTESSPYAYANVVTTIEKFSISTKTSTTLDSDFDEGGYRIDPLCGCSGGPQFNSSNVFMGGVAWIDTNTYNSGRSITYIYKIDLSANVITRIYSSQYDTNTNRSYSFTPIWMAWNDVNYMPLKVVSFNRDKIGAYDQYTIYWHKGSNQNSLMTCYGKQNFRYQPMSLTFDSNNNMYFISNGQLYKYEGWSTADLLAGRRISTMERPIVTDNGWAAVEGETYSMTYTLAIDEETRGDEDDAIIYGISSPRPPIYGILNSEVDGKYYMWKYDSYLTDRIELADFSDMSVWGAIEQFSMIADYFAGFDVEGNFMFISKDQASLADFTIENSSDYKRLIGLEVDSNEKELYNYVQIEPSIPTLEEPTVDISLTKRSDDENKKLSKGTIVISQRDTNKKRIRAECLTDGKISETNIYFKYRIYDEQLETSLKRSASVEDYTIQINSGIEDVKAGDTVIITSELSGIEQSEEHAVISDPTEADKNMGTITFSSASPDDPILYDHPVNSYVSIDKYYGEWSNKEDNLIRDPYFENWTNPGTYTALKEYTKTTSSTTALTRAVAPGDYIFGKSTVRIQALGSVSAGSGSGIYQIIPKERLKGDTTYTILIYAKTHLGHLASNICRSIFELEIKDGNADTLGYATLPALSGWTDIETVNPNEFSIVRSTFRTGGSSTDLYAPNDITVGLIAKKPSTAGSSSSSIVWIDGLTVKEGIIGSPDFIVAGTLDYKYPIGDSNIEIMFQAGEPEFEWVSGDEIVIDAPGLVMKSQEQDKNTAIDVVSIGIYGKNEFPSMENRFLNRRLAEQISTRILYDYRYPHYKMTTTMPLIPYLNFLNEDGVLYRVDVRNKDVFVQSGGWSEQCYIQQITHNVGNNTTTLVLRAVNQY